MTIMNMFSIITYAAGFWLIKKQKTNYYIIVIFLEIMIHMFLSVLCTGEGCGFQLYFIGCAAIIFYADYFSMRLAKRHIGGIAMSVCSAVLYFISLRIARGRGGDLSDRRRHAEFFDDNEFHGGIYCVYLFLQYADQYCQLL